jgi:hypothetical protein
MSLFSAYPRQLEDRWTDIFRRDALIHLTLMGAITGATFQGFLKDRFAGPIPYALADLLFITAVALWFATIAIRHLPIRGPGPVPMMVLVVTLVPALYMLYPGTPLLVQLAGLRAWSAFPIACLIALTIIASRGQARAYVGLILALCVVTAVYGILQYSEGPQSVVDIGELAQLRHGSSTAYTILGTGESDFRAFSTFTFPAPFAAMMVFGMLLAAGIVASPTRPKRARLLAAALIPLLFVGMTVSGTRAALVILLAGLLVLGWYRGFGLWQIVLAPVLLLALHIAALLTAGRILERYGSILLQEGVLWTYLYAPITIAGRALSDNLLGIGLGRTGVGVPFSIVTAMPADFFIFSDGDIGRAAVELGIIGLIILGIIALGIIPWAMRAVRLLVGTPSEDIGLGIGALVVSVGLVILIGSPLSSAPHGIIWWFLLGVLFKLTLLESAANSSEPVHSLEPEPLEVATLSR